MAGVITAAILSAIMSTIDSQLLVCSSVISEDFYRTFLRPHASSSELVTVSRLAVVGVALISLVIAMDRESRVLDLVSYAWAGFGAAFGPVILLSLFMRSMTISRPLSGFSETFSQYIMEVQPGGGSDQPETDTDAEGVLFVVDGSIAISFNGKKYDLTEGGYAYLPAGLIWKLRNETDKVAKFHWIRKSYQYVDGLDKPEPIVTNAKDIEPTPMPDTDGNWTTTRFVDPADIRHDMHVTIVTLQPGAVIPFCETHVMEHGLYVLNGKAVYRLNQDWVEVELCKISQL